MMLCGPEIFIDQQSAAFVGFQSGGFEVQAVRRTNAPGADECEFGGKPFAGAEGNDHRAATVLFDVHGLDGFAEPEQDAAVAHLMDQLVDDLSIQEFQRAFAPIDDGDVHAKCGEHGCIFNADYAAADHDHAAWDFLNLEDIVAVDDELAVDREIAGG